MKTFVLFIAAMISLSSAKGQFTQNFEGTESSLTSNCWILTGIYTTTAPADVITGNGSMYTNPPTNGSSTRDITSPALNITNTSFTVSFNYKVSSRINGNATRTIEVGLLNAAGNFTSLYTIAMDRNSPTSVLNFNQTFTLASPGVRRLVMKLGGANGDGNSRLIFDDLAANAPAMYGTGTCNSAPIAVNDVFSGPVGSLITGNILANDNDPNGETMTPSIITNSPDGVLALNFNGNFIFAPAIGFTGNQTTFTYRSNDGGLDPLNSNIATVTLNFTNNFSLPVKLINFDAKYNKPDVTLNWSTAQEKNFSHFVLEQSTDGNNFNQVAMIFGAGESDTKKDYNYTDRNLAGRKGLVYYRLKSVDMDNKTEYSSVRIIRLEEEKQGIILTTYPNPVVNELKVTIPANWQNKKVVYELFSANGQTAKKTETASSSQTETLNVSNLNSGLYFVIVTCEGQTAKQKIVKH